MQQAVISNAPFSSSYLDAAPYTQFSWATRMTRDQMGTIASAVCVFHKEEQDGSRTAFGSGFFFMDRDLVVTSRHIMEDHANTNRPYRIRIQPCNSTDVYKVLQCVYHIEQDLALLRLDHPHPIKPFRLCNRTERGFCYVGYNPASAAIEFGEVPRFTTPEPWEGRGSTTHFFEWDGTIPRGSSGGPLIGSDGGVAGVLTENGREVESCDAESNVTTSKKARARAVFIGPLMDLYFRWKYRPTSLKEVAIPFMGD